MIGSEENPVIRPTAAQGEHARQARRVERARSDRVRAAVQESRVLLASLVEAIGGEV